MALESAIGFLQTLTLVEAMAVLEPLVIFVIGMIIYSVFIFKFYKFISRKKIFTWHPEGYHKHRGVRKFAYILEYIFLFPVIAFFWFFVISIILSVISTVLTIGNIFLISMAVMTTIRITAHYDENLSSDIAKLLPFALLALFLLDISTISLSTIFDLLGQIPSASRVLVYYFLFMILLELILKAVSYRRGSKPLKPEEPPAPNE